MTRLPYEKKAGNFSRGETIKQAGEYARLLAECYYILGHDDKEDGNRIRGDLFLKAGEKMEQQHQLILMIETRGGTQ